VYRGIGDYIPVDKFALCFYFGVVFIAKKVSLFFFVHLASMSLCLFCPVGRPTIRCPAFFYHFVLLLVVPMARGYGKTGIHHLVLVHLLFWITNI
jgi:hypothetical protein